MQEIDNKCQHTHTMSTRQHVNTWPRHTLGSFFGATLVPPTPLSTVFGGNWREPGGVALVR